MPDPRWDERPLACVVCREGVDVDAADARATFLGDARRQVAAPRAVDLHRRGAEDERRQVRQEGAARAVRRRRARGGGALTSRSTSRPPSMTTTLAASVFERLGDDLWLLVPAFAFALLAGALIGRVLGVRRSFAATLTSGTIGWVVGVVVSLWIASDAHPATEGLRPQPLPLLAARHHGGRGVARVPRPARDRDARRRPAAVGAASGALAAPSRDAGCSGTPRSPASRCATASALARTRAQGRRRRLGGAPAGAAAPARARGVRGDVREARPGAQHPHRPHLAAGRRASSALLQDHVRPGAAATASPRCSRRSSTRRSSDVFRGFDWQPVAAASIGQVYRAQLPDGVARRREGAAPRHRRVGAGRPVGARGARAGDRDAHVVGREYHVEDLVGRVLGAACARSSTSASRRATRTPSRRRCPSDSHIRVPFVYDDAHARRACSSWSGSTARACARSTGADVPGGRPREARRLRCCARSSSRCCRTACSTPTRIPGNVMLLTDGRLALIDFGAAGRLDPVQQAALRELMAGVSRRDADAVAQAVLQVATPAPGRRRQRLRTRAGALHGAAPRARLAARRRDVQRDAAAACSTTASRCRPSGARSSAR